MGYKLKNTAHTHLKRKAKYFEKYALLLSYKE